MATDYAVSFDTGKRVQTMSALVSCCDTVPAHTSPAQCGRYCESGSTCFCSRSAQESCQVTSRQSWSPQIQRRQPLHLSLDPPRPLPTACCLIAPAADPEALPPERSSSTGLSRIQRLLPTSMKINKWMHLHMLAVSHWLPHTLDGCVINFYQRSSCTNVTCSSMFIFFI